jgi:hypothetical protein
MPSVVIPHTQRPSGQFEYLLGKGAHERTQSIPYGRYREEKPDLLSRFIRYLWRVPPPRKVSLCLRRRKVFSFGYPKSYECKNWSKTANKLETFSSYQQETSRSFENPEPKLYQRALDICFFCAHFVFFTSRIDLFNVEEPQYADGKGQIRRHMIQLEKFRLRNTNCLHGLGIF